MASTELEGAFQSGSGEPTGFHADLARGFGQFLGLPVTFRSVPFNTYFSHNGEIPEAVKTDGSLAYEPDVFRDADLAAFNFSDLPWRRKLMDLHPLFPTRVVLVTLRGKEISQLSDLSHKKVVVFANTSHELYLRQMKANLGLDLTLVSVPFETDLFTLVRSGGADAMVRDANGVMMYLQRNPDFNVTLPVMPTEWAHWAISRQNPVFGRVLEKYLTKIRATGELSAFWQKAYGVSFEDYGTLIGNDPPIEWTPQDRQALEALAKTGLRAAIDPEQTIYEPQSDGSARGVTYNLLLEAAKRMGVPLKLRPIAFHEYFDRGGQFPGAVKTEAGFTYRPDLLAQVDVYADTFSPLEWRKKILAFVSLYPSRLVWVAKKGGATGPGPGKKVAILANSSYQDWLKTSNPPPEIVLTTSGDEAVRMVLSGQAALTISDANLALGWLGKYPEITFFPADAGAQDLSWAVAKDRENLKVVLDKVLDSMRRSGTFDAIWQGYYRVSFNEYLGLLSMDSRP